MEAASRENIERDQGKPSAQQMVSLVRADCKKPRMREDLAAQVQR